MLASAERTTGFEPATTRLGTWCSTSELHPHESGGAERWTRSRLPTGQQGATYSGAPPDRAAEGTRTPDLHHGKVMRYQLCYNRIAGGIPRRHLVAEVPPCLARPFGRPTASPETDSNR
jgi:hypothetical protein